MLEGLLGNPQVAETLRSVVLPQSAALVLLVLIWRPWRKGGPAAPAWATALSLAAAFFGSQIIAHGWHGWYPADTTRRFLHVAVIALAAACIDSWRHTPAALRLVSRTAAAAMVVWIMTEHRRRAGTWEGAGEVALWTTVWTAATLVWIYAANNLDRKTPGRAWPLLLSIPTFAVSLVAFFAGAASFSQLAGVLVAWLHGAFLLAVWRPNLDLVRNAGTVLGLAAGSLLVMAYTSTGIQAIGPRWAIGLTVLAPLALLLWNAPKISKIAPLPRFALVAGVASLVAGAAVALASLSHAGDSPEDGLDDLYGFFSNTPARVTTLPA